MTQQNARSILHFGPEVNLFIRTESGDDHPMILTVDLDNIASENLLSILILHSSPPVQPFPAESSKNIYNIS